MTDFSKSKSLSSVDSKLLSAFEEIHERLVGGEEFSIEEYIARLPEHEETLRQMFKTMQIVKDLSNESSALHDPLVAYGEPQKQLGEFTIIREIGRGGMGVVYEAVQSTLGRRVALKILPLAGLADERQLTRFKNEARAVATLHHEHIVPVHSVGCDRGAHYLAMQFINGPSLADVIRKLQSDTRLKSPTAPTVSQSPQCVLEHAPPEVPVRESSTHDEIHADISTVRSKSNRAYHQNVAKWMESVADGLAHAHENGVVHRDIKPGNLLLDQNGNAWITDFGLARLEHDASLTATGDMLGTLRYMSPEQISGDRVLVDHRTDIYSLGLTLFELLALRPAFPETDRAALLKQIAQTDPPSLRQVDDKIPVELETIVAKATEKSPQDRYHSAAAMAEDLRRFLDQRPILAKPPRLRERVRKWFRRHPGIAITLATATVVLLLVSAGFVIALSQQQSALKFQRDTAQAERDEADRLRRIVTAERDVVTQQRDRASTALQLAITAVDEFYGELGENWIAEDRALSEYQYKLLKRSAEILPMIAANYPDSAAFRRHAGLAYSRAADALMRIREFERAGESLEKSKELLGEALRTDDGERLNLRKELASIEYELGQVALSLGRYTTAAEQFGAACQQWVDLNADFPDDGSLKNLCTIKSVECEHEQLRLLALQLDEEKLLARLDVLLGGLEPLYKQGIGTDQSTAILTVKLRLLKSASLRRLGRFEEAQQACNVGLASFRLGGSLDQRSGRRTLVEARLESALTQMEIGEFEAARENLETALSELQETFLFDGTPKEFAFAAAMVDFPGDHFAEPAAFALYARIQSRLAVLKSKLGGADAAREFLYEAGATCAMEFMQDQGVAQFAYDLMFCTEIVSQIEPLADPVLLRMLEQCQQCMDIVLDKMDLDPLHRSQYSMILAAVGQYWAAQQRYEDALNLFQRAHQLQAEVAAKVPSHPMVVQRLERLQELIQQQEQAIAQRQPTQVTRFELAGSFLSEAEQKFTPWSFAIGHRHDHEQVNISDQLFVVDGQNKRVLSYPIGGAKAGELVVQGGMWGVTGTYSVTIGPDQSLYVIDGAARAIMRFDSRSGEPLGVASAPETAPATFIAAGAGGLQQPHCVAFDSTGGLYVASAGRIGDEPCSEILRFHGPDSPLAGQLNEVFIDKMAGLRVARYIAFGPDGNLYVADFGSHSVFRFDSVRGSALPAEGRKNAEFVPAGLGALKNPNALMFDDVDGDKQPDLLVTSASREILCFDAATGDFKGVLIDLEGDPLDVKPLGPKQLVVAVGISPAQPGDVLVFEKPQ